MGFDESFRDGGAKVICGLDEAGRGPLAGPVVAGACILPPSLAIEGLDDSKKLSEKRREALYSVITESADAWGVGSASVEEIDTLNILEASLLAMRRALESMGAEPDLLLVDGNRAHGFSRPAVPVVGGDARSQSVAAASVLAKVTRDRIMKSLDAEYPEYGFARHKGYPTREHKLAIFIHGLSSCHRRTFLSFLERDREMLERMAAEKLGEQ